MQVAITRRTTYGDLFLIEGVVPAAIVPQLKELAVEGAEQLRIDYPVQAGPENRAFRIQGIAAPGRAGALVLRLVWHGREATRLDARGMKNSALRADMSDFAARLFLARLRLDQASGKRPRVLDMGGRQRSGINAVREHLGDVELLVADLLPGEGVDIVGDAHALSTLMPAESVDHIISTSVFEHLMMPWKVVTEMAKVLRPGGTCLVTSHQTLGLHELPADYWRFSEQAWRVLFCPATGFEVLAVAMGEAMAICPHLRKPEDDDNERAVGFENSSVLARRIAAPQAQWTVEPADLGLDRYPQ